MAGKGQLASSSSAKRCAKSSRSPKSSSPGVTKSPISKSPRSSQSTPSPSRMLRVVQPPRDPNKPTMLELKFTSSKGLKKTDPSLKPPAVTGKPAKATPIKDHGLKAALE
ncbi:hypothetical protein V8C35DRAFT_272408 [Trichoderma chlorosporum]